MFGPLDIEYKSLLVIFIFLEGPVICIGYAVPADNIPPVVKIAILLESNVKLFTRHTSIP